MVLIYYLTLNRLIGNNITNLKQRIIKSNKLFNKYKNALEEALIKARKYVKKDTRTSNKSLGKD